MVLVDGIKPEIRELFQNVHPYIYNYIPNPSLWHLT